MNRVVGRLFASLLLLGALAAHAQPAVPPLTARVTDLGDVLSPQTEQALTLSLAAHEDSTSNQVAVLTVPSLGGESVESYANRVFNTWGLGRAATDNGVLVLIAVAEREMRVEVGYGLEGTLTDSRAGRIIRTSFVPSFRDGDYDAGTLAGVAAVLGVLDGTYEPPEDGGGGGIPWFARLIFGVTHVLLPAFFAFYTLFQPGCARYVALLFFLVFIGVGGFLILPVPYGALVGVLFLLLYLGADLYMSRSVKWRRVRAEVAAASKRGKKTKVSVGGFSFNVGGASSSGGSSGGGFSGGGGSSGGGGASGSW